MSAKSNKPVLLIYGNCQAAVFTEYVSHHTQIGADYTLCYWQSFEHEAAPTTSISQDVLDAVEIFWEQTLESPPFPANDRLPSVHRVRFPPMDSLLLWPFDTWDALVARPEPPKWPYGRFGYGHRILMELADAGVNAEDAARLCDERETVLLRDLPRRRALETIRLKRRDDRSDVRIGDDILELLPSTRLFWTPNHPTWLLMSRIIERLVRATFIGSGHPGHKYHDVLVTDWSNALSDYQLPVCRAVAEGLGLSWWTRDMLWTQGSVHLTADQYCRDYVTLRKRRIADPDVTSAEVGVG